MLKCGLNNVNPAVIYPLMRIQHLQQQVPVRLQQIQKVTTIHTFRDCVWDSYTGLGHYVRVIVWDIFGIFSIWARGWFLLIRKISFNVTTSKHVFYFYYPNLYNQSMNTTFNSHSVVLYKLLNTFFLFLFFSLEYIFCIMLDLLS